jgi:hypothetical protein
MRLAERGTDDKHTQNFSRETWKYRNRPLFKNEWQNNIKMDRNKEPTFDSRQREIFHCYEQRPDKLWAHWEGTADQGNLTLTFA